MDNDEDQLGLEECVVCKATCVVVIKNLKKYSQYICPKCVGMRGQKRKECGK